MKKATVTIPEKVTDSRVTKILINLNTHPVETVDGDGKKLKDAAPIRTVRVFLSNQPGTGELKIDDNDAQFSSVVSKACETEILALAEKVMALRLPDATLEDVEIGTVVEAVKEEKHT